MESITKTVESFFRCERIKFEQTENTGFFKIGFAGDSGCFLGYVDIDEEQRALYIMTLAPARIPSNKRQELAEFLMRINCCLLLGNFDLDMDTGLIAYKTSIMLGDSDLHDDIIEHLLYANWYAMDRFFPTINMVVFENISPKRAFEKVEQQYQQQPDNQDIHSDEFLGGRLGDILGGSLN